MLRLDRESGFGSASLDGAFNDIADALDDLRSCYADVRQQEKEIIRLGITSRSVDKIVPLLEEIARIAETHHSGFMSSTAVSAMGHNLDLLDDKSRKEANADLAADQVLTDQSIMVMIANRLRMQDIPRDVRDAFLEDLEKNRDKLVLQAGKLPIRLGKAILLLMAADYSGVFAELAEHVPGLRPVVSRLQKLTGKDKTPAAGGPKSLGSRDDDSPANEDTGLDI
jgi:hypothetical protein